MATATTQFDQALFDAACAYLQAGLSLIPVSATDKTPREDLLPMDPDTGYGSWKVLQTRFPNLDEVRYWVSQGAQLAVCAGTISGGLLILDFDVVTFYESWRIEVGTLADGLPVQQTGGGGRQVFVRCPHPGKNHKLAHEIDDQALDGRHIAIETRAEGGYALVPPSLHPSGNRYVLLVGNLTAIPTVSQAHADALLHAARKLDEAPWTRHQIAAMQQAMHVQSLHRQTLNGSGSVIDAYNQAVPIEDELRSQGYRQQGQRWVPPSAPAGTSSSVVVQQGRAYHHDTNYPLADGHWHDAFDLFCYYQHGNDAKAAARAAATLLCLPTVSASPPNSGTSYVATSAAGSAPYLALPTLLQTLLDANRTDTGNAECLVALAGDTLRFCHTRQHWLVWNGQCWRIDSDGMAHRLALQVVRARYHAAPQLLDPDRREKLVKWSLTSESTAKLKALLEAATSAAQFATTIDQYDTHPMLLCTPSGTLDLTTATLRTAQQQDYLTMQTGAVYDPAATCPRWLRFVDEIFGGNAELIAYIQRAVGYSLTADTREQKIFLCYGGGANGKSVFLDTLSTLLGEYAQNASFDMFDAGRRSEMTNDLAKLKGARLVTMIETEADRRLAEARVKAVTGQDLITCRFLHQEFFSYKPQFKVWLAMNHRPTIRGTDRGIWRRIQLIPFLQNFEGRAEQLLSETLRAELPGILNWALAGLQAWQQQGLGSCSVVEQATADYKRESDDVAKWIDEYLIADPWGSLVAAEGYEQFFLWSRNRGEQRPMTHTTWGRSMGERGYQSLRRVIERRKQTVYVGVRLRTDNDPVDRVDTVDTVPAPFSARESASHENMAQLCPTMSTVSSASDSSTEEKTIKEMVLTHDWQAVPEGWAVPPGADIRMDFAAGVTYARLLPITSGGDVRHDQTLEREAQALVAQRKFERARQKASGMRGRKDRERVLNWIEAQEREQGSIQPLAGADHGAS